MYILQTKTNKNNSDFIKCYNLSLFSKDENYKYDT